jgi:hypothetical protein
MGGALELVLNPLASFTLYNESMYIDSVAVVTGIKMSFYICLHNDIERNGSIGQQQLRF